MRLLLCLLVGLVLAPAARGAEPATAILSGGCFWCTEKDFDHVDGVLETTSGYIGGKFPNPTYQSHVAGGDLEAVQVTFDPDLISYRELVDIYWRTVDVTDDGGQFCDRGNSYRTTVWVLDDAQRADAEASKADAEAALGAPIVTRILDAPEFWPAEEYHQDYYLKNPLRYRYYRFACGRDRRIQEVWGDEAMRGVQQESS
ncbi:MAG: peptide-methionine (S)-S-oxide reductase MsrA [Pseudomonadota bacterium]